MTNQDQIKSLHAFAVQHNELAFAHLCTAALPGWSFYGETLRPVAAPRLASATWMQDVVVDGAYRTIPVADLEMFASEVLGEAWATERIAAVLNMWGICQTMPVIPTAMIDAIRSTNTARPDGAIARSVEV